jgi:GAF domain/PilZ domain
MRPLWFSFMTTDKDSVFPGVGQKRLTLAENQGFGQDRRRCLRHRVRTPAFASFDGVTGGMILDLSEQGIGMQSSAMLQAGRPLEIRLDLPGAATLETSGYVAWADALGRAGVRFSDLPDEARERLKQWLAMNASTPSRKAPKFSLGEFDLSALGAGSFEAGPLTISLEPEAGTSETRGHTPISTTVQYEFNPLGSDLESALRHICERTCALTRATGAAIALTRDGSMTCHARSGTTAPPVGSYIQPGSAFSGECVRTARSLRCDDARFDSRVNRDICHDLGIRSILAAPIQYEREVIGVVEVFSTDSFAFDEGDVAVVERLAQTVLLSVSQATSCKARRILRAQANTNSI